MTAPNETTTQPIPPSDFKSQLDKRALEDRIASQPKQTNPVVEKIVEYVPAAAKILKPEDKPEPPRAEIPGPPERPHHDDKIEEFVRDQHRSKVDNGDESRRQGAA
ncbi:hypothetical protein B0I35DRAFT_240721 [Stachybotrys elegans]|uniref:Uncharacterized protein n=1 Tax=Stachybotrys elegans TaxID=80388 RepID=A0A8K0SRB6_9HYPO|nr:hypothetical protein B0I35DRAFT_240721 [Stachybotrys elegans]